MSSTDVFTLPPIDYTYDAHRFVPYNPTLTGIDPITFAIAGSDDWVDLADSRLIIKVRLNHPHTGYDGLHMDNDTASTATETRNTLVSNNFGHTLFKQVDLTLNGSLITPQGNNYHHLAMLQTLVEYSRVDGETKLVPQGWVNEFNLPRSVARTSGTDDHPTAGNMSTIAPKTFALTSLAAKTLVHICHSTSSTRLYQWSPLGASRGTETGPSPQPQQSTVFSNSELECRSHSQTTHHYSR